MKKNILLFISLILIKQGLGQCETKFGFFSIKRSTMELCFIDTAGEIKIIGNTNLPRDYYKAYGMDINPVTKELYLLGRSDSVFILDKRTGNANFKFKLNDSQAINNIGIAISFNSSGELYIFDEEGAWAQGKLRKVTNMITGECHAVSSNTSGLPSILGIEFDATNTLWASDECCMDKMHQLSITTGLSISNSSLALNQSFPCELDFSNDQMYGIAIGDESTSTTTTFYKVEANGSSQTLFSFNDIYLGMAGYNMPVYYDTLALTVHDTIFVTVTDTNYVMVNDTNHVIVTDTNYITITDTNYVTIADTNYISVTDTLVIVVTLTGNTPQNNINTNILKIYPNPASTHIYIDNGNYTAMNGYTVRVDNSLSQTVFTSPVNQQQFFINLSSWSGKGTYFVYIIDHLGNTVEVKKIILK
jgi:hypothetical protein